MMPIVVGIKPMIFSFLSRAPTIASQLATYSSSYISTQSQTRSEMQGFYPMPFAGPLLFSYQQAYNGTLNQVEIGRPSTATWYTRYM